MCGELATGVTGTPAINGLFAMRIRPFSFLLLPSLDGAQQNASRCDKWGDVAAIRCQNVDIEFVHEWVKMLLKFSNDPSVILELIMNISLTSFQRQKEIKTEALTGKAL